MFKENLKFACMGDSITSDEVTGTGTVVCEKLKCRMIGNFAHGNAVCSDWAENGKSITKPNLNVGFDVWGEENTLSNQVLALIQKTTKKGGQIKWTHPLCGEFSVDENVGVGTGEAEAPDIIYIAISVNDGKAGQGITVTDDTDEVFLQSYNELSRVGIASGLRWAIETLRSAYPDVQIFVATPLQANNNFDMAFAYKTGMLKREIIKKVCTYESVKVIDSFAESGFSQMTAISLSRGDGLHPSNEGREKIASYVANEIMRRY